MKIVKNILPVISLALSLNIMSCDKNFDEYNTNPDKTTKVTPELLATGAELSTFRIGGDAKAQIGYSALPKYVAYITEGALDAQYNSIGAAGFDTYTVWPNLNDMIEYAKGGDYETAFQGLSHFIKAFGIYNLTMKVGDVPYTEAGLGKTGNSTPKYDTQESVFASILSDLKSAEDLFAKARKFNGDIIYDGDVEKWRKASNTMQLKVLMALSKKITPDQKARFAEIVKSGNIMTDNSDNFAIKYTDASGTWHPLYNQPLFDPYTTLTTVVADELKRLKDRRIFYYGEPAKAMIDEGKKETDFEAYVGADPSEAFESLNVKFQAGKFSIINKRYNAEKAGDPLVRLSYAEQCFILAEAVELGWITGDAKSYYDNGVKAAMKMVASFDSANKYNHGSPIDDAYIQEYLKGSAAYSGTKEKKLEQIWMQKYIMKFLLDAHDSYFDCRRTGYPKFPINQSTSMNIDAKDKLPVRWTYPTSERGSNFDSLDEALQRQFNKGYDGTNEIMWILK